jgi:hypothetical protein
LPLRAAVAKDWATPFSLCPDSRALFLSPDSRALTTCVRALSTHYFRTLTPTRTPQESRPKEATSGTVEVAPALRRSQSLCRILLTAFLYQPRIPVPTSPAQSLTLASTISQPSLETPVPPSCHPSHKSPIPALVRPFSDHHLDILASPHPFVCLLYQYCLCHLRQADSSSQMILHCILHCKA